MPLILGVMAALRKPLVFAGLPYFGRLKSANWLIHLGPLGDRAAHGIKWQHWNDRQKVHCFGAVGTNGFVKNEAAGGMRRPPPAFGLAT